MTGPVPPEALRLARAAVPFVNSGACRRILEAAAPAIEAAAEERFAAAAREELAGPLAELGAQIAREATAAERERCAQLAEKAGAIYPLPRPVPAVEVNGEPVGDTAGNTVIWPDGMPAVGLVSCLLREQP